MNTRIFLAAALCLVTACTMKPSDETEKREFEDSTGYLEFSLSYEMPAGADAVSAAVRASLLDILHTETVNLGFYEDTLNINRWEGSAEDIDGFVSYYGGNAIVHLGKMAKEDADSRIADGWDPDDFPGWECNCSFSRVGSSKGWWVYLSENYVYLGGAHGGVTGAGYLTYNKSDGTLLKNIIDTTKVIDMQPLLRKGLIDYFTECGDTVTDADLNDYLFIEDGIIPIPHYEPWPGNDGLSFIYQQYEIAPYAAGMPTFTVPYEDVKEFLSPEALKVFGLR